MKQTTELEEITAEMAAKIEKARKELRDGRTKGFDSASEAQEWLDQI